MKSLRSLCFWRFRIAIMAWLCLGAFSSHASLYTFTEVFDSPHDGIPRGWVARTTGTASTVAITELVQGGGDWRLIMRRDTASQQLIYFEGKTGEGPSNGQFSDFESSVVVRIGAAPNDVRGIVGRASGIGTIYYNGYHAYTWGSGTENYLTISLNPRSSEINGTALGTITLSERLLLNTDYLYQFSAVGETLTASVLKRDANDNFTIVLGELSVMDATYAEGYFGFRNIMGNNGRATYFSDLEIRAIPEQSTAALALIGIAVVSVGMIRPLGLKGRRN